MATIGKDIEYAADLLKMGEVIGMPTETVYGLAGNALDDHSILKIFEVKNRPKFDPLIAHIAHTEQLDGLVEDVPPTLKRLIDRFWPGPLTVLLDKKATVPDVLTSGLGRVAIRMPDHSLALSLLAALDFPLAAPSANPFGYVSPTTASHVQDQLGDKISYVLDGGSAQVGVESTIVGVEGEQVVVYRLGGIPVESLEKVVGNVHVKTNQSSNPAAPGMLKSHYSPGKKLLPGDISELLKHANKQTTGIISFKKANYPVPESHVFTLSPEGSLSEAAKNIFAALRHMDQPDIQCVLAEYVPDVGLGRAINDRLRRAAILD